MDRTNVIGEKVKSLRTAKEISLEELADRTGLAVEQITRIEENIDIPSLAPLVKLARALGVRLGTFLDDQPDEAGPVVCRRGDADDTISFSNNALDAHQHLHYHSLSRSKTDRHMEPFIVDINANGNIKISNNWSLSFNSGYDFQAKEITQTSCTISRDLHCFNLSASLSPFGRWKYYNVTIRANASILQDLKYEQRSQTQSNIQWY